MEYVLPENLRTREEAIRMRDVESCPQAAGGRPRTKATESQMKMKFILRKTQQKRLLWQGPWLAFKS